MLADAYAGLALLSARPDIFGRRVPSTGFSYGVSGPHLRHLRPGRRQVGPRGLGFRRLRGVLRPVHRPLRRQPHDRRAAIDAALLRRRDHRPRPLRRIAADLRAGGSRAETSDRLIPARCITRSGGFGRRITNCNLCGRAMLVERDGTIRDPRTGLAMTGPTWCKIILGLCTISAEPYQKKTKMPAPPRRLMGAVHGRKFRALRGGS